MLHIDLKRVLILLLCTAFCAAGCMNRIPDPGEADPTEAEATVFLTAEALTEAPTAAPTEAPTPVPTAAPAGYPEGVGPYAVKQLDAAAKKMDEIIGFIEAHPCPVISSVHEFVPADKRSELTEKEREVYDEMLRSAEQYLDISFDCPDEVMENALAALKFDRPDIEICFDMAYEGGCWHSVYFLPEERYYKPASDMNKVREQVEAFTAVGSYVAYRIPESFSAIDRYRAIAYFISLNSQYAHVHGEIPRYASTAYGALINGYSICQGYAIGFEYLCRCANIDCRRVRNAYNDENMHFWDIVTLDQGTYYVDVTWCDGSSFDYSDNGWYKWFMFTAERQHRADDGSSTTGPGLDRENW